MGESTVAHPVRAWVLHPDIPSRGTRREPAVALAEAVALAAALPHLEVVGSEVVRLARPHAGLLFGAGRIAELKATFTAADIGLVLVDGPVSPVQQRNLEKEWDCKLLDRTGLILEIFSDRARTREGVLQVEMAALSYQRTRLVRAWTHLERQRGGFGFVGGPGETQIESDRRAIDAEIVKLKRQLERVTRTRTLHRSARAKVPWPIVALVGYTNAGKSTLFNRLTGAQVVAADMLFATLDPTMRAVSLPGGLKAIVSDTVGFISDLPTELVAAFRATLEEVLSADLIVHVRDISHAESAEQAADVREILHDLGVADTVPVLEAWNKADMLGDERRAAVALEALHTPDAYMVAALKGEGIEALREAIAARLGRDLFEEEIEVPFADGRTRARLHEAGVVESEHETVTGHSLRVRWSTVQRASLLHDAAPPASDAGEDTGRAS